MTTTRGPGKRAGLSRAAVLDAARELLTEKGLDALTMRALAARLAVAPNALYSHVAGKTELVDALLDDVLRGVEQPSPESPDPIAALDTLMTSTFDVLLTHADLVPSYLTRGGARGPHAVRLGEIMDALLARAGLPADVVPRARATLIVHAIGSAAYATGGDRAGADEAGRATFASGLRWLLAGISAEPGTAP